MGGGEGGKSTNWELMQKTKNGHNQIILSMHGLVFRPQLLTIYINDLAQGIK